MRAHESDAQNDYFFFPEEFSANLSFQFGNKRVTADNRLEYTDQLVFATISPGEFFGARALLTKEEFAQK